MAVGHSYERYFIDIAKLAIDCVKDIFEREKSYPVSAPGKKFLETLDWKEIHLSDDEYTLKIYPVSRLPSDPAGQLQTITEYIQAGFISPRAGRRLLDFPDLEQAEDLSDSAEEWLHKVIEEILDEGKVYHPEPDDDLPLAKELGLQYLAFAKINGAPEENLQMLRDFISEVDQLMQMALQDMQMQQAMAQQQLALPQAAPMPTPKNELIPNVPAA